VPVPQTAHTNTGNEIEIRFARMIVQVHAFGAGYVEGQRERAGLGLILKKELAEMHGVADCYIAAKYKGDSKWITF